MSHNTVNVSNKKPDVNGNISVELSDLSNVSGTASTNQFLKYDGTNWTPTDGSSIGYIFIGHGESNAYSNSPHGSGGFASTSDLYVYDTSPVNTISGATITSTNNWVSSITLPAGNYLVSGQILLKFSSSGYAVFSFHNSSNTRLSQSGVIGTNRITYHGAGDLAYSIIELSSQTTIKLKLEATGGTIDTGSNQGNTPSEHGLIIIEKLS